MKKVLFTIALLFGFAAVHAETINFTGSPCQAARNCFPVANALGVPISLYANPAYPNYSLYVDGVMYTGANNTSLHNNNMAHDGLGNVVVLDVTFSYSRYYVSGRGAHWVQKWDIVSGSVAR